jgi:hypothetical protein
MMVGKKQLSTLACSHDMADVVRIFYRDWQYQHDRRKLYSVPRLSNLRIKSPKCLLGVTALLRTQNRKTNIKITF